MRLFTWGERLGKPECPYIRRWVLNFGLFSIRVHHWYSSDDHRALHDHPFDFVTLVLKGSYTDIGETKEEPMPAGRIRFRPAEYKHWVKVAKGGCWTLLLTGPQRRKWGFYPNGKFRKSNKYFFMYGHHPCQE